MSIKISELPQATSVGSSDIVPIVQGGTTKQATAGMIAPTIATSITSSSTNDEVAGAKAVHDFADNNITWGTINNPTSYDWTLPATHNYTKVPITIARQKSNIFSIVDNEIVVSKNIKDVAVSLKIPISTQSTSENRYILFEIIRNGASVPNGGAMTETYCVGSRTTTVIIPMTLTAFQANDHVVIKIYGQNGDKIYRSNLQMNILGFNISDATTTLNSLNTASLMNTGSLVGMGDRAEITPLETTEDKTEGSGDIL